MSLDLGVLVPEGRMERLLSGELDLLCAEALAHERELGVRKLFFAPNKIDLDQMTGQGVIPTASGWKLERRMALPKFCYNTIVQPYRIEAKVIRELNGQQRTLLFNETNRWNRDMTSAMLRASPATEELVPKTTRASIRLLCELEPGCHLLAPSRRALKGRAILIDVEPTGGVTYTDRAGKGVRTGGGREWGNVARSELPTERHCLSPLPGRPVGPGWPVEWRFYLIRGESGAWKVVAGVAKRDALRPPHLCERSWTVRDALAMTFGSAGEGTEDRLRQAALKIVESLTLYLPGIAHLAVDLWLDGEGRAFLADLVGGFRVDWLQRIGDVQGLQRLAEHPARFATALAAAGGGKLDVDFGRNRGRGDTRRASPDQRGVG